MVLLLRVRRGVVTMYTLYVDKWHSFSVLVFPNYQNISRWLREHNASLVAPTVWAIDDGFAAQTEEALDAYMAKLARHAQCHDKWCGSLGCEWAPSITF